VEVAFAYDPRCLAHDNGSMVIHERVRGWLEVAHAESPARIARAIQVLEAAGVRERLATLEPRLAEPDEILLLHSAHHLERIRGACDRHEHAWVGPEARVGPASWEPAMLAAGAGLAAVDQVCERGGRRAYCLVRPPGHHASRDRAMGFCLFNNVALAANYARQRHGVERVAIVDWDVHHGNGTQELFYGDGDVLFVSLHQERLYPADSGTVAERGEGPGLGATLNLPLPAGCGDAGYLAACERVAVVALRAFEPELILLSSGQDAAASDPLGRMSVTTEGFRAMTRWLVRLAEELCGGRLVAVQEGGYSVDHMPFCVLSTIEALAGLEPSFERDPVELDVPDAITTAEAERVDWLAERLGADAAPERVSG
jgi:acetoin utilization deacetylase AcuC-like enzyme